MFRIFIKGVVQGVGFRPYIFRKAVEAGIKGHVSNVGSGVEIISNQKDFAEKLTDVPPLARIDKIDITEVSKRIIAGFSIKKSESSDGAAELPADIFMCEDCLKELNDTKNRRHKYYFITCTNCGPRFSMINDIPYDRAVTTMNVFDMCSQCKNEYTDPGNRRYHAQTIACKDCGPKLSLLQDNMEKKTNSDSKTVEKAVDLLKSDEYLSIKGVGGFHICCRANNKAVDKIREEMGRKHKPFALMVKDLEMAEKFVTLSDTEKKHLLSAERPIVVTKSKEKLGYVSELDTLGVMLPYTALHFMLFTHINEPLVMTSCNKPGSPVKTNVGIGKYQLIHDRGIVNRCDDSVIRIINDKPVFLRRSRGFVPRSIPLAGKNVQALCLGAEMNNAIACVRDNRAYISQYIGETSNYETFQFMKDAISKMIHLTKLKPEVIVCDLHPDYNSTKLARELSKKYKATLLQVQHHMAHIAGVAAEHGLADYVGIAVDGLGYGLDGNAWGGEVFQVKKGKTTRVGHLEQQPMIGGDKAVIYPMRMLFGILSKIKNKEAIMKLGLYTKDETNIYSKMLTENFNVVKTTSCGRILDAAAALLGICDKRTYDGRPAMLLESAATIPLDLPPKIKENVLDTTYLFEFLLENMHEEIGVLAATVQTYLARGLSQIAKGYDLPTVLSGGVAYNKMLSEFMQRRGVLVHKEVPCGDGGICFGQAVLSQNIH